MFATLLVSMAGLAVPPYDGCATPVKPCVHDAIAPGGVPENTNFFDNFDSYASGSMIAGQGGWETWDNGAGTNAPVSGAQATSAPNSLNLVPGTPDGSDIVHQFAYTSGKWVLTVQTYVPSGQTAAGYVILMNTYAPPTFHWSMVMKLDPATGLVSDDVSAGSATAALVLNQWVEVKAEIDLDADTLTQWYNGQPVGNQPDSYSANWTAGGLKSIAAIDLYSNGMNVFMDDVSIKSASCYPDCEGDGDLDVFDFLCFQGSFANQAAYADCEGDGDWDVFDFLCFQGAFATGCN